MYTYIRVAYQYHNFDCFIYIESSSKESHQKLWVSPFVLVNIGYRGRHDNLIPVQGARPLKPSVRGHAFPQPFSWG